MNSQKPLFFLMAILFFTSVIGLLNHNMEFNRNMEELKSLNNDLKDGSLDNYSNSEAERILMTSRQELPPTPLKLWFWSLLISFSLVSMAILYPENNLEGESDD